MKLTKLKKLGLVLPFLGFSIFAFQNFTRVQQSTGNGACIEKKIDTIDTEALYQLVRESGNKAITNSIADLSNINLEKLKIDFEKSFKLELLKGGLHIRGTISVQKVNSLINTGPVAEKNSNNPDYITFSQQKNGFSFSATFRKKSYIKTVAGCGNRDRLHRHFGKMVRDKNGVLHIAYRRASSHYMQPSQLIYRSSNDSGRNWSAEHIVADGDISKTSGPEYCLNFTNYSGKNTIIVRNSDGTETKKEQYAGTDIRDPGIGLTKSGDVIIAASLISLYKHSNQEYIRSKPQNKYIECLNSTAASIVAYRKVNGTWNAETVAKNLFRTTRAYGQINTTPEGNLLITANTGVKQIFYLWQNSNVGWKKIQHNANNESIAQVSEFDTVVLSENRWLAIGRPSELTNDREMNEFGASAVVSDESKLKNKNGMYYQFKTENGGKDWTQMGRLRESVPFGQRSAPILSFYKDPLKDKYRFLFAHGDRTKDLFLVKFADVHKTFCATPTLIGDSICSLDTPNKETVNTWSDSKVLLAGMKNASGYGSVLFNPQRQSFQILTFQEFDHTDTLGSQVIYMEIDLQELEKAPFGL